MEKKVNNIYNEAYDDISKNWIKFMDSHAPKLQKAYDALQEAIKSGDKAAIDEAKDKYQRTAMNITVNNKRFQGMADETAAKISHTNEVALAYVNDQVPGIYTVNYNAFKDEKIKGYSFALVNEQAVKNLAKADKLLLPTKKVDIPKDMRWNEKLINSQMLQGILQGESIPKLAKRLSNVTDMNRVSAIRNARTMTTAAENKGRNDSYVRVADDGAIMKRVWVATNDERTRAWHAELDGVEVGIDEPWENEYGEISYPGDPSADPCNVYNCRCAMRVDVKGFNWNQNEDNESYQYHATKSSSISGIIEKGLKPNRGHVGEGVYFADSPKDAVEWTTETSTGGKTVLRVKESFLDKDKLEKWSAEESGYDLAETVYNAVVPFEQIEVKVGDDEWWSLAQYANQHRNLVYNKLRPSTQRKVDKIVEEEWEEYLKRKGYK